MNKFYSSVIGGGVLLWSLLCPAMSWAEHCNGVLLRQHAPTSVSVGQVLTYKIQLANEGACTLDSVVLTDYLPRKTVYREGLPAPTQTPSETADPGRPLPVHSVRWTEIKLTPGSQASFEVKVQILPPANRTITDTACIEHPNLVRTCKTLDIWVTE